MHRAHLQTFANISNVCFSPRLVDLLLAVRCLSFFNILSWPKSFPHRTNRIAMIHRVICRRHWNIPMHLEWVPLPTNIGFVPECRLTKQMCNHSELHFNCAMCLFVGGRHFGFSRVHVICTNFGTVGVPRRGGLFVCCPVPFEPAKVSHTSFPPRPSPWTSFWATAIAFNTAHWFNSPGGVKNSVWMFDGIDETGLQSLRVCEIFCAECSNNLNTPFHYFVWWGDIANTCSFRTPHGVLN